MDVCAWLIEWFDKNTGLSRGKIEKKTSENYLQNSWIDSFKFISLISDLEENFGVHFSNDEFQDRIFSTIEGLTKIIETKINGKK